MTCVINNVTSFELNGYERIVHSCSAQQLKVLCALARLGGVSSLSKDLMRESGVLLSGSVNKALNSMVKPSFFMIIELLKEELIVP